MPTWKRYRLASRNSASVSVRYTASQSCTGHHVRKGDCRRRRQHVPSRTNDATRRAGRSDPTKSDRRRDSLCGLERGQQHGLPDHRHHERHADHRARHFPCRRTDPVPDQPPLPRRTPAGPCGRNARAAYRRVHYRQHQRIRSRTARRMHAAARRRQAVADRSPPDAYIPLGENRPGEANPGDDLGFLLQQPLEG